MRPILLLPVALVLLAGCGADPADRVRTEVAALTEAANAGDADLVRDRADALLAIADAQREAEQLSDEQAQRLIALAQSVRKNADLIDADLLEQRRLDAEAAAEATAKQLEEAKQQLEAERKKAEEAARTSGEEGKKGGKGKDD